MLLLIYQKKFWKMPIVYINVPYEESLRKTESYNPSNLIVYSSMDFRTQKLEKMYKKLTGKKFPKFKTT